MLLLLFILLLLLLPLIRLVFREQLDEGLKPMHELYLVDPAVAVNVDEGEEVVDLVLGQGVVVDKVRQVFVVQREVLRAGHH